MIIPIITRKGKKKRKGVCWFYLVLWVLKKGEALWEKLESCGVLLLMLGCSQGISSSSTALFCFVWNGWMKWRFVEAAERECGFQWRIWDLRRIKFWNLEFGIIKVRRKFLTEQREREERERKWDSSQRTRENIEVGASRIKLESLMHFFVFCLFI